MMSALIGKVVSEENGLMEVLDTLREIFCYKKKKVIFVPEYRRNNESEGNIYFRTLQISWTWVIIIICFLRTCLKKFSNSWKCWMHHQNAQIDNKSLISISSLLRSSRILHFAIKIQESSLPSARQLNFGEEMENFDCSGGVNKWKWREFVVSLYIWMMIQNSY